MSTRFLGYDPQSLSPQYLEDLATAYWFSEVLFAAVDAGVFDLLAGGGKRAEEIAEALGFEKKGTERFLNALCALGLLREDKGIFFNTGLSESYLVRWKDGYQGHSILWRKFLRDSWRGLLECLKTGGRVFYPSQDEPEESRLQRFEMYIQAMDDVARTKAAEMLQVFEGVFTTGRILDVGAGSGAVAAAFLQKFPGLSAVLVDLPEVLRIAEAMLRERGLGGRFTCCAANILEPDALPSGDFDLVILSNIIHAYSEKEVSLLLSQAVERLGNEGYLLIHDLFPEHCREKAALMDLNLFVNTYNGRVFSASWLRNWLRSYGLCCAELVPLRSDTALVIAAQSGELLKKLQLTPLDGLVSRIRGLGFRDVRLIPPAQVQISDWVVMRCRYGCMNYGKPHCPPNTPPPEKTRALLQEYSKALLLEGEPPTKDFQLKVLAAEREAFLEGYYKALAFWAGPCSLCLSCSDSGICRDPRRGRPSMEGCGIDVYETARRSGFSLRTLRHRNDYIKYFALLLLE